MNEIVEGVTYKEYLLTLIRIITFLDCLGENHKKILQWKELFVMTFF